jgi:hypothetical protein
VTVTVTIGEVHSLGPCSLCHLVLHKSFSKGSEEHTSGSGKRNGGRTSAEFAPLHIHICTSAHPHLHGAVRMQQQERVQPQRHVRYAANSTGSWVGATCNVCAPATWEPTATCSALPLRRGGDDGAGAVPRPRGPPRHRTRRAITARDDPRHPPGRDRAAAAATDVARCQGAGAAYETGSVPLRCDVVAVTATRVCRRLDDDAVES